MGLLIASCTSGSLGSPDTIDLGGDAGRITSSGDESDSAESSDSPSGVELQPAADSPPPPASAAPATADWIFDGDSLEITFDDPPPGESSTFAEVRLIGVNAPEGNECSGDLAKDALIDRMGRADILVQSEGYDDFGRLLAFIWHDGELINLWLVENGLAVARSSFGHTYDTELDAAESRAQAGERGMWSPAACGEPSDAVVVITELNFDAAGPDNENPNGEWIELTNLDATAVDLRGWTVRDESTRHRYEFGSVTLGSDESLILRSGCGSDSSGELFWCDPDGSIWSNSGDTAFVYDSNEALVDTFSYSSIYE